MRVCFCYMIVLVIPMWVFAQKEFKISGSVYATDSFLPLENFRLKCTPSGIVKYQKNHFTLTLTQTGSYLLYFQKQNYEPLEIQVHLENNQLDLGPILLETLGGSSAAHTDNLVSLDLVEAQEEQFVSMGNLSAYKSTLETHEAFNFAHAFYSPHGLDRKHQTIRLLGVPLNDLNTGRMHWNQLGGLNPILRNSTSYRGYAYNPSFFGTPMQTQDLNPTPDRMRAGLKLQLAGANKSYTHRLLASYSTKLTPKLQLALVAGKRWAESGYIQGTPYLSNAVFGVLQYHISKKHRLLFTAMYSDVIRGRNEAITEEVHQLLGPKYNPAWGYQNTHIRNAKEQRSKTPLGLLQYQYTKSNLQIQISALARLGERRRAYLGYYNAPNPSPVYYRYLPSYYLNKNTPDFDNAAINRKTLLSDPQIRWKQLFTFNRNQRETKHGAYVLEDAVSKFNTIAGNAHLSFLHHHFRHHGQLEYRQEQTTNYAQITDMLGGTTHTDIDPFDQTNNDLDSPNPKRLGDKFKYHYLLQHRQWSAFYQLYYRKPKWEAFASVRYRALQIQRTGLFKNEKYPSNSKGLSEPIPFSLPAYKIGGLYRLQNRHRISAIYAKQSHAAMASSIFINLREQNTLSETTPSTAEHAYINYEMKLPKLQATFGLFFHQFEKESVSRSHYLETGIGAHFVRELQNNINRKHTGGTFAIKYNLSPNFIGSIAASYGKYQYSNNPKVSINFDENLATDSIQTFSQTKNLGAAKLKGLYTGNGPQLSLGIGLRYRSPKFWWVGSQIGFFDHRYTNVAATRRTNSFWINPKTNKPYADVDLETATKLLQQEKLPPLHLMHWNAGKSWRYESSFITLFLSIQNVFNQTYKTGGYEQARKANYEALLKDKERNTPSFGNKYWFGYGRTFFVQLSISF